MVGRTGKAEGKRETGKEEENEDKICTYIPICACICIYEYTYTYTYT